MPVSLAGAAGASPFGARVAVDLSPEALVKAGLAGVALGADLEIAAGGRWTLATRADDLSPDAVRVLPLPGNGALARVEVRGPLEQRATFEQCGGYVDGYDAIEGRFARAVAAVQEKGRGVVHLDVDSPGGLTASGFSTFRRMRALADRAGVRVIATASEVATSMGFGLLLVGDERYVPERGRTASIGTAIVLKPEGGEYRVFRSGERKMRPNAIEPLNREDEDELQARVDDGFAEFAQWVSERTGLSTDDIAALRGASLSGTQALEKGLITGTKTAHEVIDMVTAEALRAEMAEAHGLPATATAEQIKARAAEGVAAIAALDAAKAQAAKAEAEAIQLREAQAREKAQTEAAQKRAAFAADVKAACDAAKLTPTAETALLAHYDAHGEASARATFEMVRAAAPIVNTGKPGGGPVPSAASDDALGLTADELALCKSRGLDPHLYAERKNAGRKKES